MRASVYRLSLPAAALLAVSIAMTAPLGAAASDDEPDEVEASNIPAGAAFGVGVGFLAPAESFAPNVISARWRVSRTVALEPHLHHDRNVATERRRYDDGPGPVSQTDRSASRLWLAGVDGRFRVAHRGDAELLVLGGVQVRRTWSLDDPNGVDEELTESTTAFGAAWGLGVNWWVHPHFCVSADVRNPLVELRWGSLYNQRVETSVTTRSRGIDVAFAPTARFMGHVTF